MARSSDDSETEDDFVFLGTPVPELDETETSKKPTTVQDLTAKDKEGRRRFHGAFTGGFSAGYFNTVGSKEGFTPSTFVSSRSQKQEDGQSAPRPEDFMDDDDLEEHGIAPRKFATAGNYTSEERKRKLEDVTKRLTQSSTLDLGSTLNDLVIPEYLPIGIKLLRKMGWREGQGLGPRVRKKRKESKKKKKDKSLSEGKKIYGCAMPPSSSESDDSDSFIPANLSDLTFAPTDMTPVSLNAKDDVKGLGYRGLDPSLALPGSHINLFSKPVRGKKGTGKGIKGHAFGVGALEDEDDDIFAQDSISNYDLTMREDGDDDEQGNSFGWTAPRTHSKQKLPVSYVGKLLEGFCLSSKPLKPSKKFPRPKLPADFKPFHWTRRRKKEGEDSSGKPGQMSAVDRGLMLGETPIMGSVFDLVQPQDKARMDCAKDAIQMTKSLDTSTASSTTLPVVNQETEGEAGKNNHSNSKFLSRFTEASSADTKDGDVSNTANQNTTPLFKASLNLQPFRKDPSKQARFDQYLAAVQRKAPDPFSEVTNNNRMTEWEKARERDEFSRSGRLFRPMSAMMSSRFRHGAMLDDKNQDTKHEDKEAVSDEVKAAELRMFGKLTREELEWHPDKLVCKRFNVPNPYPGSDVVGLPTVKRDKFSIFNFLSFGDYQPKEPAMVNTGSADKDNSSQSSKVPPKEDNSKKPAKEKATLSSIFSVLDDPDFHKPPAKTKPDTKSNNKSDPSEQKMEEEEEEKEEEEEEADIDLFRAIFKNSDSEDSEADEKSSKDLDESMSQDVEEEKEDGRDSDNNQQSVTGDRDARNDVTIGQDDKGIVEMKAVAEGRLKNNYSDSTTPVLASSSSDMTTNTFSSSVTLDPGGSKAMRTGSRWDKPNAKSVFSVLDEINNETPDTQRHTDSVEEVSDSEYGPALPPPSLETTPQTPTTTGGGRLSFPEDKDVKHQEKDKHQHRGKHKHKKEKTKKSRHKSKKDKKHKKSKKSSKSKKKVKAESSGSDADSETSDDDSNVSDEELLNRFLQVSKSRHGKS